MESILNEIKKMLGIEAEYTHFDTDIIVHINTALMTLHQLGVGPEEPVLIMSSSDTWEDTLGDIKRIQAIKTYIYLKVKLTFDPPTSSFVLDAMKRQADELEWRLNTQVEYN